MKQLDETIAIVRARKIISEAPHLLRELREAARLTQGEVAGALGVSAPTVSLWERSIVAPRGRAAVEYIDLLTRAAEAGGIKDAGARLRTGVYVSGLEVSLERRRQQERQR